MAVSGTAARRRLGNLVSPLFYRFVDVRVRPGRRAALASLMETEYWSVERLRDLQEGLLRRLLTHAIAASPWHRARLKSVDPARFRLEELERLPILERRDLQDHLDEIAGPGATARDSLEMYSSGSTGTPMRVYQSREYQDWYSAGRERSFLMCKPFRFGMPRAFLWGTDIESRDHRGAYGTARDILVNLLWFDAFALRRDALPSAVRRLRDFRPVLVIGYVSALNEVARALDGPLEGLGAVESAAETLTSSQRATIGKAFGAPVFNRYTTREVGTLAHECEAHQGLHMIMENTIIEVVDAAGKPLATPGAEGEILVTSLRNLATPLIRYRLGDIARLGGPGCVCGRAGARLESVLGRTSDVIVSPSGVLLHGEFFGHLFYDTPVVRFRVDQETPERLRVRIVPASHYSDEVRQRVVSLIHTHGDRGFDVVWEVVDEIPSSPSGKFRFTASHVERRV